MNLSESFFERKWVCPSFLLPGDCKADVMAGALADPQDHENDGRMEERTKHTSLLTADTPECLSPAGKGKISPHYPSREL